MNFNKTSDELGVGVYDYIVDQKINGNISEVRKTLRLLDPEGHKGLNEWINALAFEYKGFTGDCVELTNLQIEVLTDRIKDFLENH